MMSSQSNDPRRRLPAMHRLFEEPRTLALMELYGRALVRVQATRALSELRQRLDSDNLSDMELDLEVQRLPELMAARLEEELGGQYRRVINATGVFIHTNLGRAPLPPEVTQEISTWTGGYLDLEMDLTSGKRSDRNLRVERLLMALTGAQAAVVVNNNAAAVLLALRVLAGGRDVVVSRGELVEIGGSFRMPDIMEAAGVRLVEVGTTNRTRIQDYEDAIGPDTGLLLKVHQSNFAIHGFVASVGADELVDLGRRMEVPVMVDEGGGLLKESEAPQLKDHPSISRLVEAGVDVVCGSGDKLLGGPQAGILVGNKSWIRRCRRHPLYRALRPGRLQLATLCQVLRRHLAGEEMPLDRIWAEPRGHRERVESVARRIGAEVISAEAFLGGGAAPHQPVPGEALALPGDSRLLQRLRLGPSAVVGYLDRGRLVLDLRTVDPSDDERLVELVGRALESEIREGD